MYFVIIVPNSICHYDLKINNTNILFDFLYYICSLYDGKLMYLKILIQIIIFKKRFLIPLKIEECIGASAVYG